jgi:hypothetical protein
MSDSIGEWIMDTREATLEDSFDDEDVEERKLQRLFFNSLTRGC